MCLIDIVTGEISNHTHLVHIALTVDLKSKAAAVISGFAVRSAERNVKCKDTHTSRPEDSGSLCRLEFRKHIDHLATSQVDVSAV